MKNLKAVSSVLLCITVFSTGAVTMIIELLGAKLLAPFFGTSLYTWTAVIATTLSALAGGYYYGGRISDTLSKEATDRKLQSGGGKLFGMIALAGAFLALVPAFQMGGLKVCSNFGLRGGALAASVLFMAFPLFIMGTVMPQVVKLAFRQESDLGHTVGGLWALSTGGSLAGTLLTGFYLIPNFGNVQILYGCSAALLLLSGVAFFRGNSSGKGAACLLGILVPISGLWCSQGVSEIETGGNVWKLVHKTNSNYGSLSVIDRYIKSDTVESGLTGPVQRGLFNDALCQSLVYSENNGSSIEFFYALNVLISLYNKAPDDVLVIGVGAGLQPMYFARKGARVDAVDINPRMLETAERFFDFGHPNIRSHAMDGRAFLHGTSKKYDVIVLDAFLGESVPSHLLTREMFREVQNHLRHEGVVVVNYLGQRSGKGLTPVHAVLSTMAEVFPVTTAAAKDTTGVINMYLAGSTRYPAGGVDISEVVPYFRPIVRNIFTHPLPVKPDKGLVLTDNYNPIEIWDLPNREQARRIIHRNFKDMTLLYL